MSPDASLHQPSQPHIASGRTPASVVAIDGPVASGKTAVGLRIARELGYRLVDTGMMYRALTWLALQRRVSVTDEEALTKLADEAEIELGQPTQDGRMRIRIDSSDVTSELRSPGVDRNVSYVSMLPGVREAMVRRQRELAAEGNLVMLGRDIGSVVLPDAPVKIYLDASALERAKRRHHEIEEGGLERPLADVLRELEQRDQMDRERHASPLKPAEDAIVIDTDDLTLEEVTQRVLAAAGA